MIDGITSGKALPAEVLYDSVLKVTGAPSKLSGGGLANELPDSALDLLVWLRE